MRRLPRATGRSKLDSIPFSTYHVVLIVVLGFVGLIEGYDRALSVCSSCWKSTAHLTPDEIRWPPLDPPPWWCSEAFGRGDVGPRQPYDDDADRRDLSTLCTLLILLAKISSSRHPAPHHRHRGGLDDLGPFLIAAERRRRSTDAPTGRPMRLCGDRVHAATVVAFVLADDPSELLADGLPGGAPSLSLRCR